MNSIQHRILANLATVFGIAAAASAFSAEPVFETDVYSIFQKRCSGCHFPEAERMKSGLDLSTAAYAIEGGDEGVSIVPGDVAASKLIGMLEWSLEPHMPPPKKEEQLSAAEIDVIRRWIAGGALSSPELLEARNAAVPEDVAAEGGPIGAVAYDPSARWYAEGARGGVRVFGVEDGIPSERPVALLSGHEGVVRALAFSVDGGTLAAGSGAAARRGEVRIWDTSTWTLVRKFEGHRDIVQTVALSPDGKLLASGSYDKTVRVWDLASGETVHHLRDHVDAVFAVAFSPDGKYLATGAGDRTVKIWDVATGDMELTISDSLGAVLTLAFSPTTGHLAGAGRDKIIRVWDVGNLSSSFTQTSMNPGSLVASTFAHDGPVLTVAYGPAGERLYSTGEDRQIKVWSATDLSEVGAFEEQSDWVTGLAVSPDGNHLAIARYDESTSLYDSNALGGTGVESTTLRAGVGRKKVTSLNVEAVVIEATVPPTVSSVSPARWHRGSEVELAVRGKNLDGAEAIVGDPGITVTSVEIEALDPPDLSRDGSRAGGAAFIDNARPYRLKVKLAIGEEARLGRHDLWFRTPIGTTNSRSFFVLALPDVAEEKSTEDDAPMALAWPVVVSGKIAAAGEVDEYRVAAVAGQEIVFVITDSSINAIMDLRGPSGEVVATNAEYGSRNMRRLGYRVPSDGEYRLSISERDSRSNIGYRLHVGEFPFVTGLWPLGLDGVDAKSISASGFNLGEQTFSITPPESVDGGTTVGLPITIPEGSPIALPRLPVSSRPSTTEHEPNDVAESSELVAIPITVNGRIERAGDRDHFRFRAERGQRILIETQAARFVSELDSFVEILDADGAPLKRGELRSVAQTAITLNNRDSRSAGIRLESWRDFEMRDYLMVGSEIIRVEKLPDYGDEDVSFFAYANGQRRGYFGTTPEHHAVNTKVYKVEVHSPETVFAPNGMPQNSLYWRNDDGFFGDGNASGDSFLEFDAPYGGEFVVRVRDARGGGGTRFPYRLALRFPSPDYSVVASPQRVNVARGSRVPIEVRVRRVDGFDAPVRVWIEDLPAGFSVDGGTILPGENRVKLGLFANGDAASMPVDGRFRIRAEAEIDGETIAREKTLGPITINTLPPDLVVHENEDAVSIRPGESAWVSVKLARDNGFYARVPLDVLNLPYGVRVLDTGLNGILVREGEFERSMEIYVEPWTRELTRPIFVQARIETPSAGNPVFLSEAITLTVLPANRQVAEERAH